MKRPLIIAILVTSAVVCTVLCSAFCSTNASQNQPQSTIKPQELDLASFTQKVGEFGSEGLDFIGKKPVLIDFYATWCGPCKQMAPALDRIAQENTKITVYKVDVDKNQELAQKFQIRSLPTLIYIPLDGPMGITKGYMNQQAINESIDKFMFKK